MPSSFGEGSPQPLIHAAPRALRKSVKLFFSTAVNRSAGKSAARAMRRVEYLMVWNGVGEDGQPPARPLFPYMRVPRADRATRAKEISERGARSGDIPVADPHAIREAANFFAGGGTERQSSSRLQPVIPRPRCCRLKSGTTLLLNPPPGNSGQS